jgi:hypothetical protein
MNESEKQQLTLPSIFLLFKKTWGTYWKNMFAFSFIGLFPTILLLMVSSSFPNLNLGNPLVPFYFAILIAYLIAWLLHWPAWFALVRYQKGAFHAVRKGVDLTFEYWFTFLLFATILIGASFFFLLPSILLFVILSFAFFVVAYERKSGIDALLRSKALTTNIFWELVGKYIALFSLFAISVLIPAGIFLALIDGTETIQNGVIFITVHGCFIPLMLIAGSFMYKAARRGDHISENKPAEKILIILLSVLGMPIFMATMYVYTSNAFWLDEGPFNSSDLRMDVLQIEDDKNAFFDLQKAHTILYASAEAGALLRDHGQGTTWDQSFVDSTLSTNRIAIEFFESASTKPQFQIPKYNTATNPHLKPELNFEDMFLVIHLVAMDARDRFLNGDEQAAFEEALRIVRVGYLIEMSKSSNIEYSIGSAIRESGLSLIQDLSKETTLPAKTLQGYAEQVARYRDTSIGLVRTLNEEYLFTEEELKKHSSDLLETITSRQTTFSLFNQIRSDYNGLSSFYYKPNKTHRLLAQAYRDSMNRVREDCGNASFQIPSVNKTILAETEPSLSLLLTENSAGKIFLRSSIEPAEASHLQVCNMEFYTAATQTMLAIRAYENTNGSLPPTLDILMEYISTDPFSPIKAPLQYNKEEGYIYSIGKDHIDAGGSWGQLWKEASDPTISLLPTKQ